MTSQGTLIPESCSSSQITEGLNALLRAVGVRNPEHLAVKSLDVREGKVLFEVFLSNEDGGPIIMGKEGVVLDIEIGLDL